MRRRVFAAGLAASVLVCGQALADDAIRLTDRALDAVTAAVSTGIGVGAGAESGGASALSIASLVNTSGLVGAEAIAVSPEGAGVAQIGGPVLSFFGGKLALSIGILGGRELTSGNGDAAVDAAVLTDGDIAVSAAPLVRAPLGGKVLGVAVGVAVDNPIGAMPLAGRRRL